MSKRGFGEDCVAGEGASAEVRPPAEGHGHKLPETLERRPPEPRLVDDRTGEEGWTPEAGVCEVGPGKEDAILEPRLVLEDGAFEACAPANAETGEQPSANLQSLTVQIAADLRSPAIDQAHPALDRGVVEADVTLQE